MSIVDQERRFAIQPEVEATIAPLLALGRDVVAEFGSWTVEERARLRGGEEMEQLITFGTDFAPEGFVRPTADEGAGFDVYVGPGVEWAAEG